MQTFWSPFFRGEADEGGSILGKLSSFPSPLWLNLIFRNFVVLFEVRGGRFSKPL